MKITFVVPGEPQGKARPRVVRGKNGRAHSYTPEKTAQYEELVRREYLRQGGRRFPDGTPLLAHMVAFCGIPKSASKKRRAAMTAGREYPAKKPDLDNIIKAILDALNGVAYKDDAQVVEIHTGKRWGDFPCVLVELWEVGAGLTMAQTDIQNKEETQP